MTLDAAKRPYDFDLYTRAIAVGDYPVDHHHNQNPRREELSHLWYGKIPSFSVPMGVLVPVNVEDLLLTEKNISVSWEMNGATRWLMRRDNRLQRGWGRPQGLWPQ